MNASFAISVAKENLKFSAAHFIAYPGFREPLHGHNYQVAIRIEGPLSEVGYVIDFGVVKELAKEIVARLDERVLIPEQSECLDIARVGKQIRVRCGEDEFAFPAGDVCLLPIAHSSAEELARFIWCELREGLGNRGMLTTVNRLQVEVAEATGQSAIFEAPLAPGGGCSG